MRVNATPVMSHVRSLQHLQLHNQVKSARNNVSTAAQHPKSLANLGASEATKKAAQPKPPLPGSNETGYCGPGEIIQCGPPADPNNLAGAPSQSLEGELTLKGLIAAWGQTKSPYDLTGNGIVDVDDLLQFINGLQVPPANPSEPAVPTVQPIDVLAPPTISTIDVAVNSVELTPETPPQPLTLQGLVNAWGQSNTPYDLNNDGTVNVDDLLKFINGLQPEHVATPQLVPESATLGPAGIHEKSVKQFGGIAQLADTLLDKLNITGFAHQPPTNIRELIHKLGLSRSESNQVLDRVSRHYPRGLGVNAVG